MNSNKHWGELTCSGRVSSSCFSHHVTLVKNLVISLKEDMRTCDYNKQNVCLWSSVRQIIHTDKQNICLWSSVRQIIHTDKQNICLWSSVRQIIHTDKQNICLWSSVIQIIHTDKQNMSVVICKTDNPY
jgi:hypothetical protein